ncbi:MAG: lipid II flippase MurJ [Thermoanaerobaculia bacterium]
MLIGQAFPALIAVASIRVMSRNLDAIDLGVLSLVWLITGYTSSLDLGLARATTRRSAQLVALDDGPGLKSLITSAVVAEFLIGVALAMALSLLAGPLGEAILRSSSSSLSNVTGALRVTAIAIPATLCTSVFLGVLQAQGRFLEASIATSTAASLSFVIPALLSGRPDVVPVSVGAIVGVRWILTLSLAAATVRRMTRGRGEWQLSFGSLVPLLAFGSWVTVTTLIAPLLTFVDRFVVVGWAGIESLPTYSLPFDVVVKLSLVSAAVGTVLFPSIVSSWTRGEQDRTGRLLREATDNVGSILVLPVIVVVALAVPIIDIWLGPHYNPQAARVLALLGIGVFVNALAQLWFASLQAIGRPDVPALLHLIEVPVHVAILFLAVIMWGAAGAAIAWTLRVTLDAWLLRRAIVKRVLPEDRAILGSSARRQLLIVSLLGVASLVVESLAPVGWRWLARTLLLITAAAGVLFCSNAPVILVSLLKGRDGGRASQQI